MDIDLDRVPTRESGMSAYEILLSESQERMLVVVQKGKEEEIKKIFDKWDLHAEVIGEVIDVDRLIIHHKGKVVVDVSPDSLVLGGGAPVYIRETKRPEYLSATGAFDASSLVQPANLSDVLTRLLRSPNIASKRWVYEQYDSMVRTNNIVLSEADAAVVLIKETDKALALKTDCNGRYVYLNPRRGGMIAVAESARNVVCTGATPVAITNCLNFGNPYKPEVYWQFKEAVAGMGEACRAFDTPVTGGNVSFYNESPTASVYPTPVIGMLGVIDDIGHITTAGFKEEGDIIILLGENRGEVGGSEYLAEIHKTVSGDAPTLDLDTEKRLHRICLDAIRSGLVKSAHDCSEGGLAVTLAECCIISQGRPIGATVRLAAGDIRPDFLLFGEDQSRSVVTAAPGKADHLIELANSQAVTARVIGKVGGRRLQINNWVSVGVEELAIAYGKGLEDRLSE
jgi:phosphoribosylformylglycinamidine synthase